MGLFSKIFGSKKKGYSKVKNYVYTCKWCEYKVFPGEVHFSCEEMLKKYKCEVCTYPIKPGCLHMECREYLKTKEQVYPFCIYCKRVCIPGKPHRDCIFLATIEKAEICGCCGFKILEGLEHKYCKKFTLIR